MAELRFEDRAEHFSDIALKVYERGRTHGIDSVHYHSFNEMVVVAEGRAVHLINGRRHDLRAGDVFVINPGVEHGYEEFENFKYFDVLYDREELQLEREDLLDIPGYEIFFIKEPEVRREMGIPPTLRLKPFDLETVCGELRRLAQELNEKKKGYAYCSLAILMGLTVHISRCYDIVFSGNEILLAALNYLKDNLANKISLDHLAKISNMSRSNFVRQFRHFMGCSAMEYVIACRISEAKKMLTQSDLPIGEIACRCGFEDSNYFARCCKKQTGLTPSQIRHSIR
jgi:AraC family L-rhamnose operon transcriptional activator RhaR/AraC family L-rhamnose operon regulatory protein RhaS